jgi:hypothetical protein
MQSMYNDIQVPLMTNLLGWKTTYFVYTIVNIISVHCTLQVTYVKT